LAYEIYYMPIALEQLRALTVRQQRNVVDAVEQQLIFDAEVETRNRKRMRPNNSATWELRIAELRVFYEIEVPTANAEEQIVRAVNILAVGIKRGNQLWIGNEEVQP